MPPSCLVGVDWGVRVGVELVVAVVCERVFFKSAVVCCVCLCVFGLVVPVADELLLLLLRRMMTTTSSRPYRTHSTHTATRFGFDRSNDTQANQCMHARVVVVGFDRPATLYHS
jgi:hypothetical protein